jgi:hypothetical protein
VALSVYGLEANAVAHDYFCSAGASAGAEVAVGFFKLLMMIVINGMNQQRQDSVQRMVDHSRQLRLQRSRLKLQCVDRGVVDFVGEFKFTPCWRPCRDRKQNRCNPEVERGEICVNSPASDRCLFETCQRAFCAGGVRK